MASALILAYSKDGELIYDPFCGSGTVALEAWRLGRRVIATDLNPYAVTLTRAKLFPCVSIEDAMRQIASISMEVEETANAVDLRRVPQTVRRFFHPETLRETIAWARVLQERQFFFLLSCLMGILHHQRPGFLSYPSSHTVPYLRTKRFPRSRYPKLYEYRSVRQRLEKKVFRALKRIPELDFGLRRGCSQDNASTYIPPEQVDAIITSPPYMRQLDYGRDNRLRLWFLGTADWQDLDGIISPSEAVFLEVIRSCLARWRLTLRHGGLCVLVLGDSFSRTYNVSLPDLVAHIAVAEIGGYTVRCRRSEAIPNERRVRRGYRGNLTETVLVLRNEKTSR